MRGRGLGLGLALALSVAASNAASAAAATAASAAPTSLPSCVAGVPRDRCQKEWAVLLYLQAEGDLTPHALRDLRSIECGPASASGPRHDVVVQLDANGPTGLSRLHLGRARHRCAPRPGEAPASARLDSPVVAELAERHGDSEADKLRDFLVWAIDRFPARHHLVVVWGHGQGWADAEAKPRFGGLARNLRTGGFIDGKGLRAALTAAAGSAGRQIDLFAADACLMQSVESIAEAAGPARYVAGSPQIQSYQGLPYAALLSAIASGKFDGAQGAGKLAAALPRLVARAFRPGGELAAREPGASAYVAWSAIDAERFSLRLVPALRALGAAVEAFLAEDGNRKFLVRSALRRGPAYKGDARDLGVVLRALAEVRRRELADNPAAKAALDLGPALSTATAALDDTVVARALGSQYSDPAWSGFAGPAAERAVSAWIPETAEEHAARADEHSRSTFYRATSGAWSGWLDRLFAP